MSFNVLKRIVFASGRYFLPIPSIYPYSGDSCPFTPICGRYVSKDQASLERHFNLVRGGGEPFKNVYNAAPTFTIITTNANDIVANLRDRPDSQRTPIS
jgi:hypothetical protein